jgi:hypothetical protein
VFEIQIAVGCEMSDLFSALESYERKQAGMARAADGNWILEEARSIASKLGRGGVGITADDVGSELDRRGFPQLGPAAGSLFKGKQWVFTGERKKSTRKSNHARELKVWRLV